MLTLDRFPLQNRLERIRIDADPREQQRDSKTKKTAQNSFKGVFAGTKFRELNEYFARAQSREVLLIRVQKGL